MPDSNKHTRMIDFHCMALHDQAPCVYVLKRHDLLLWKENSFNTVNDVFSFLAIILNNQAETALVFASRHTQRAHIILYNGLFCLWGACLTSSKRKFTTLLSNSSISVSLPLFMHHSLYPPTTLSPCRWPFRAQPRWSPKIHSAFRLSATFERPWSAATYRHRHTYVSTQNLKRCKADIQLYIKCTNTHTHSHTSYVHTITQVSNLVHTAKTLVWLRFLWSLPTGLVQLKWLRPNTYG